MTTDEILNDLDQLKAYYDPKKYECIEEIIDIFEAMKKAGISEPAKIDFSKLK